MLRKNKITLVLLTVVLLLGCDDFGDINVDQNRPSEARPELLLTSAQREISTVVSSNVPTTESAIWVQYIAETQYTDMAQYATTSFNFNPWYTGPLQDLQTIINMNTDEETREDALSGGSNANQIAAARILKVYFYHFMTDRWGAIPYSEALQGRDNFSPAYDQQEDIYPDLINELNEAVAQMDDGPGVTGDFIFNGDMEQWVLFANSLRARIALRMADVEPALAEAEFVDAVNSGLITENVMYPFLAEAANENPWYTHFRTRTDFAISDVMADYMLELEDPRILRYADPAPNLDNQDGVVTFEEINGMPYGAQNAGDITNAEISFPGQAIRAQGAPLPIITTSELNFAQAEAIERGWGIAGTAEEFYLAGIQNSWTQWGVFNEDDFAAYVANPEVAYGTAEWQERIGNQKWIALFPNGYEAWAEWRRLDFPELEPHPFALNQSGEIPVRHVYPSSEAQLNTSNYDAAVAGQGPDTPDTHLWWDVE